MNVLKAKAFSTIPSTWTGYSHLPGFCLKEKENKELDKKLSNILARCVYIQLGKINYFVIKNLTKFFSFKTKFDFPF